MTDKTKNIEFIKSLGNSILIILITTSINYFIFLRQFQVNKIDRLNDEKYRLIIKANDELSELVRLEGDMTFLDFYYDIKLKKWLDSLKVESITFFQQEDLLKELFYEHNELKNTQNEYKIAGLKLYNTLSLYDDFFVTKEYREKFKVLFNIYGNSQRREIYENFKIKYCKSKKITDNNIFEINPHFIADSMRLFYSRKIGEIINTMEKDLIED